jgi:hypothetical protein
MKLNHTPPTPKTKIASAMDSFVFFLRKILIMMLYLANKWKCVFTINVIPAKSIPPPASFSAVTEDRPEEDLAAPEPIHGLETLKKHSKQTTRVGWPLPSSHQQFQHPSPRFWPLTPMRSQ